MCRVPAGNGLNRWILLLLQVQRQMLRARHVSVGGHAQSLRTMALFVLFSAAARAGIVASDPAR
jgi:hypothetical protein